MDEDQKREQEELERLLNEPEETQDDSGEDDNKGEETPENENNNGSTPPAATETEDKDSEKDNAEDDENNGKEAKDRWNGRSREEVIKEYEALEQKLTANESKGKETPELPKDDKKEQDLPVPSAEELQKMTPTDFAKWVMTRIDEGVKKTVESQTKIRDSVRKEITEAKKDHPLDDPDYRKMVMTIIDAASAKGTTIPLKEACKQVDAFIGKHKGQSEEISDEERSRLKKAKAQVESGAGAPTTPDGSDADTQRIQKALGGSGSKSPLGGLGI